MPAVVVVGVTMVQSKVSETEEGDETIHPGEGATDVVSLPDRGEDIHALEWPRAVY